MLRTNITHRGGRYINDERDAATLGIKAAVVCTPADNFCIFYIYNMFSISDFAAGSATRIHIARFSVNYTEGF